MARQDIETARPSSKSARSTTNGRTGGFHRGADETRAELLAAARDVFLEVGSAGFSLREVARRVGVSPAAVYRHYECRDALALAACMQGFQLFSGYLAHALVEQTPLRRLLATTEQYRLFALANARDYRFIFVSYPEDLGKATPRRALGQKVVTLPKYTTIRFLVDRVRECTSVAILAPNDVEATAVHIWAHVHGLISLRLSGHLGVLGDGDAFAAYYRASMNQLLDGLRPTRPPVLALKKERPSG